MEFPESLCGGLNFIIDKLGTEMNQHLFQLLNVIQNSQVEALQAMTLDGLVIAKQLHLVPKLLEMTWISALTNPKMTVLHAKQKIPTEKLLS